MRELRATVVRECVRVCRGCRSKCLFVFYILVCVSYAG